VSVAEVNGAPWDGPTGTTVDELVAQWSRSPRGIAVAINGEVVPKSSWGTTRVSPGDRVEIVTATAGG
jgi:sulfur carrier protein